MKTLQILLLGSILMAENSFAGIKEAQQFLEEKNYNMAVAEAKNTIVADKTSKEAYEVLLKAYEAQNKTLDYLNTYKDYLSNEGSLNFKRLQEAAAKAFQLKQYKLSNNFIAYGRSISPQDASLLNLMGVNFFYLKQYKQSIAALRFAVKYSNNLDYLTNLARSYAFDKQNTLAIKNYEKVLSINPRFSRASLELKMLKETGQPVSIPVVAKPLASVKEPQVSQAKVTQAPVNNPSSVRQAPAAPTRTIAPSPSPSPSVARPALNPAPVNSAPLKPVQDPQPSPNTIQTGSSSVNAERVSDTQENPTTPAP